MSIFRVASRYAKSIIELSNEQKVLDDVLADMKLFSQVCDQNRDFVLMLKNPVVKHDKKRRILHEIFGNKVSKLTLAFFDIITRKNREAILPAIAKEFLNQYNAFKGIEVAKVTTAVSITKVMKAELEEVVRKISSLKEVQLKEEIDKEIIGGFILKVGDRQIDDSIKSKIKALHLKFSQNPYIKEF